MKSVIAAAVLLGSVIAAGALAGLSFAGTASPAERLFSVWEQTGSRCYCNHGNSSQTPCVDSFECVSVYLGNCGKSCQ